MTIKFNLTRRKFYATQVHPFTVTTINIEPDGLYLRAIRTPTVANSVPRQPWRSLVFAGTV